jgi:SAM-dependent methyltransferase
MKLILPEKRKIIKTSEEDVDPSRYYGNPIVNFIYRKRLQLSVNILGNENFQNIVDAGCGQGILIPTLRLYSKKVVGMDKHDKILLIKKNIGGYFIRGSIFNIPFKNLECIFLVSVLEHLDNLDDALTEIKKSLKPNGKIIIGIPSDNFFTKLWFTIKKSPALRTHKNNKKTILENVKKYFLIESKNELNIVFVNLYTVLKCHKK